KVSVALPAPAAGVLSEQRFAVGSTVKVGEVIGTIAPQPTKAAAIPVPAAAAPSAAAAPPLPPTAPPQRPPAPSLRRALREQGETPAADAKAASATAPPTPPPSAAPRAAAAAVEEVIPMSPLRRRIAERLVAAQHTAAILTTFNEVDMSAVMALRTRYQEQF